MNLYEINNAIMNCIDEETGEIIDFEEIERLALERDTKIENLGCWYKNLISDAAALKAEIDALTERRKKAESKAEQLKNYIGDILSGGKFETSKVKMSFGKSTAVECDDEFIEWAKENNDELLSYKEPTPNKTLIKQLINSGEAVEHAAVVERLSLNIK